MLKTFKLVRTRPNLARLLTGGRVCDAGRLPRYALFFLLAGSALWAPIIAYVRMTPETFISDVSLILPGSGAQASVNLTDLGQASSSASSAFSSSRISPTQTYKRLLAANRTVERAAKALGVAREDLGSPRIKLVDETSLIHFSMSGPSPLDAQARAAAILTVFAEELDALRQDELDHRASAAQDVIIDYEQAVHDLREEIALVQQKSGLLSFDHFEEIVAERDRLMARAQKARSEKAAADASMGALASQLGTDSETAAINLRILADPEVQVLAQTLAEQTSELAEARGRFGARHPVVSSAMHTVAGTQFQLAARSHDLAGNQVTLAATELDFAPGAARTALLSELVTLTTLCESKAATLNSIEHQLNELDLRIAQLAPQAARLDDLSRDYQVAEAVFASALARTDTSKSEVYASYPLVQVLADASLPASASSPRPKIAIAAGIAATVMVLMALALAWLRQPLISKLLHRTAA